jgi:hypothetical protein
MPGVSIICTSRQIDALAAGARSADSLGLGMKINQLYPTEEG